MIIFGFWVSVILRMTTASPTISTAVAISQLAVLATTDFSPIACTGVIVHNILASGAFISLESKRVRAERWGNPYFTSFLLQCHFALWHLSVAMPWPVIRRSWRRIRESAQVRPWARPGAIFGTSMRLGLLSVVDRHLKVFGTFTPCERGVPVFLSRVTIVLLIVDCGKLRRRKVAHVRRGRCVTTRVIKSLLTIKYSVILVLSLNWFNFVGWSHYFVALLWCFSYINLSLISIALAGSIIMILPASTSSLLMRIKTWADCGKLVIVVVVVMADMK